MATTHEFASETRTELWKNQHLQLYVYTYFDKFIWMLVNEMPNEIGSVCYSGILCCPQYFHAINIFDVITHVSDI